MQTGDDTSMAIKSTGRGRGRFVEYGFRFSGAVPSLRPPKRKAEKVEPKTKEKEEENPWLSENPWVPHLPSPWYTAQLPGSFKESLLSIHNKGTNAS